MSVMRRRMMLRRLYTPVEYLILTNMFVPFRGYEIRYTDRVTFQNNWDFRWGVDGSSNLQCAATGNYLRWFGPGGDYIGGLINTYNPWYVEGNTAGNVGGTPVELQNATPTDFLVTEFGINESLGTPAIANSTRQWGWMSIERSGVLVLDAIPAIDYAGKPCYYDRVERQFFYPQGDGTAEAGPANIDTEYFSPENAGGGNNCLILVTFWTVLLREGATA